MQFVGFNFVTTFYIRKTKDGSSYEQRSWCYFDVWCPTDFTALRLYALWLKIKTWLIRLQQRFGRQEYACAWGLEKNLWYVHMTHHFVLPFSVWWWGEKVTMQVWLTQAKRDVKMETIRSPNDAWKGYLKTWDRWNSQSIQNHCPWTPQGGVYSAPYEPPVAMVNVLRTLGYVLRP